MTEKLRTFLSGIRKIADFFIRY